MANPGARTGEESAEGARDRRVSLVDLVRRVAGGGARDAGAPEAQRSSAEIGGLVERMIAEVQESERRALDRCAELERRLGERGKELVVLAEELRRSYHETKLERRARERLTDRVGHGLVAPLANLLGLIEAAAESRPLDAGRPWLVTAARMGRSLFEDVQSWCNEAEHEPDRPVLIPFRPADSLRRVVDRVRPLAEARGLLLEIYDRGEGRLEVFGDPRLFEGSVEALVQHAIECTETGFVALEMWSHRLEDDVVALLVNVEDTAGPDGEARVRAVSLERTARLLVEQQGGWLDRRRDPERGGGWRLTLELPLRPESVEQSAEPAPAVAVQPDALSVAQPDESGEVEATGEPDSDDAASDAA